MHGNGDGRRERMTAACKKSDWCCVYHACMTNDCQRSVVRQQGYNYGPGSCEKKSTGIGGSKSLGQTPLRPQPKPKAASVKIQGGGIE